MEGVMNGIDKREKKELERWGNYSVKFRPPQLSR